jgi:hypothetical protein
MDTMILGSVTRKEINKAIIALRKKTAKAAKVQQEIMGR